jgi:hypothetical protein
MIIHRTQYNTVATIINCSCLGTIENNAHLIAIRNHFFYFNLHARWEFRMDSSTWYKTMSDRISKYARNNMLFLSLNNLIYF